MPIWHHSPNYHRFHDIPLQLMSFWPILKKKVFSSEILQFAFNAYQNGEIFFKVPKCLTLLDLVNLAMTNLVVSSGGKSVEGDLRYAIKREGCLRWCSWRAAEESLTAESNPARGWSPSINIHIANLLPFRASPGEHRTSQCPLILTGWSMGL